MSRASTPAAIEVKEVITQPQVGLSFPVAAALRRGLQFLVESSYLLDSNRIQRQFAACLMPDIATNTADLLDFKTNVFSQNGEDGIIEELFRRIGIEAHTCCEFGAWDGIYLSNCRRLIDQGWRTLFIEAMPNKFEVLQRNFRDNPRVTCVNRLVDAGKDSLGSIVQETGFPSVMDFLSVDIDGLDYEIFRGLDLRPRVICIEVNAAHAPETAEELPRAVAANSVGQPMKVFMRTAREKGYSLVAYTGNAFFVRDDVVREKGLAVLTAAAAYDDYLRHLDAPTKEWLYLVTRGLIRPYRRYLNSQLSFRSLGIKPRRLLPMAARATAMLVAHAFGFIRTRVTHRAK